jgi:hypothetical protein
MLYYFPARRLPTERAEPRDAPRQLGALLPERPTLAEGRLAPECHGCLTPAGGFELDARLSRPR